MAGTQAKAIRKALVMQRLAEMLHIQPADLHATAKGDAELAQIVTLERIADALEGQEATKNAPDAGEEQPPVTVETVVEKPLKTTETVEIVPADEAPPLDADTPSDATTKRSNRK